MPLPTRTKPRDRVVGAPSPSLCVEFVNTRCWRGTPQPSDDLHDVQALRRWLQGSGVLDDTSAASLLALPAEAAERLLDAALAARESLYRLLRARANAAVLPSDASAALAGWVLAAPPRRQLVMEPGRAGWRVPMRRADLAEVLAPVWWSAADLMLAKGRPRLGCCANPRCGWLFVDDSKGGTRRWCSMSACGNRAKVQRHAQRRRALSPG